MPAAQTVATPAAAAEREARQFLSENAPPINYKTGLLKETPTPLWTTLQQHGDCVLPARGQNPMSDIDATLDDVYKYSQTFAVNQPLVRCM